MSELLSKDDLARLRKNGVGGFTTFEEQNKLIDMATDSIALRAQLAEAQAEIDTKWNISLLDSDDPDVDGEFDTLSEDHNGTVSIERYSYTVIDGWDTTERVLAWRKVRL